MGEEGLSSPPPEPSPLKGEGSGSKVTRLTYLPLSAFPPVPSHSPCDAPLRDVVGVCVWH
jgi:hypothetical protein